MMHVIYHMEQVKMYFTMTHREAISSQATVIDFSLLLAQ